MRSLRDKVAGIAKTAYRLRMTTPVIDASFPGGNILLDGCDGDTVRLRPDLRDTQGGWFYWSFRVRGAAGRSLTFQFTEQNPIGVRGPAVSLDEGLTWFWLGNPEGRVDAFRYAFPQDAASVRFCFGMGYTDQHWQRFCGRIAEDPAVREEVLCITRLGRPVPRLRVGCLDRLPRHRLVLTARHHCCEMMASYALEGFVAAMLAGDATGRWFRTNVEAAVLPFMDRDGVEAGDQGKNRRPHDHNRDYGANSVHVETQALRDFVVRWSGDRLTAMADLHCPWIRGRYNEFIYQVGNQDPRRWQQQQRFGGCLERVARGPLPYCVANDLPFGQEWNTGPGPGLETCATSTGWFSTLPDIRLATGIEIPYANSSGSDVTADTARAFGRDLAGAMRAYLCEKGSSR